MKKLFRVLCGMSVMSMIPAVAGAVGTYYNGNLYQNPQQRYSRGGYYNSYGYGSGRNYGQSGYGQQRAYGNQYNVERQLGTQKQQGQNKKPMQQTSAKQGFVLDAGISHEIGSWKFDMNKAGSRLHYDNLAWNVLDAKGTYYFGDNTKMQITAGLKYGMQYGDSSMIDDDISDGSIVSFETLTTQNSGVYIPGDGEDVQITGTAWTGNPAMSAGTSKGGNQLGYNVAFGLTDFFTWGKMKVTPSIGYRYFKHKLTTKNNKGMAVGVFTMTDDDNMLNCLNTYKDELQCVPYTVFGDVIYYDGSVAGYYGALRYYPVSETDPDTGVTTTYYYGPAIGNMGGAYIDTPGTYYYVQPGTSHKYETEWFGPYLALDMEYQINNDNFVTAGVEFGLPKYDSKGDQPYRWDWAHPTSVEDKGDFGDAYHLGMNANWKTNISDSMYLTLGFTFDYYKVSDATATTYLNGSIYQEQLDGVNDIIDNYDALVLENKVPYTLDYYEDWQKELNGYRSNGWKIEDKKEINSVYKSMGIRVGINMKF